MSTPDPVSTTDHSAANGKRRLRLIALAVVVAVIGIGYGVYWFLHARSRCR